MCEKGAEKQTRRSQDGPVVGGWQQHRDPASCSVRTANRSCGLWLQKGHPPMATAQGRSLGRTFPDLSAPSLGSPTVLSARPAQRRARGPGRQWVGPSWAASRGTLRDGEGELGEDTQHRDPDDLPLLMSLPGSGTQRIP